MQCPRCKEEITPCDVNITAMLNEDDEAVDINVACGSCGHTIYGAIPLRYFK